MKHKRYSRRRRRLWRMIRWLWAWSVVISGVFLLGFISFAAVQGIREVCEDYIKKDSRPQISGQSLPADDGRKTEEQTDDGRKAGEQADVRGSEDRENTNEVPEEVSVRLVNKSQYLPTDYQVPLTTLKNGQQVASVIYPDLCNMLSDGENEQSGLSFLVCSGYRNAEEQQRLLEDEIAKNAAAGMDEKEARADALLTVAPAHYSEHETGLAVDIVAVSNQRMDETQEYTAENIWLRENCYQYGFILRYPQDKEEITGFSYESWHFRYVGKEAAKTITEQGITLEEYLQQEQ
ncbi:MAG: M15 family metallopeptidase [Clostridium sp.]|nr:M15 family metallopeptidase [Clostridium sp.]